MHSSPFYPDANSDLEGRRSLKRDNDKCSNNELTLFSKSKRIRPGSFTIDPSDSVEKKAAEILTSMRFSN